jgi:hypothetical protein
VQKNIQEKIILFIFSIFSFCNIGLTEGKIHEEKKLPPFIREALLSECPGRDVDSVNYPVIKGFAILIKNGFSAIGHGVLDIIGVCNNTIKPSNTFNFIARLPLSIKDIIIQNNNNILSNIGVKSLINISDMHLKPGSGFLNNSLFFIERYHIAEALYVTSVIGCLFLIKPFLAWNWGLGDPERIKNKAEKKFINVIKKPVLSQNSNIINSCKNFFLLNLNLISNFDKNQTKSYYDQNIRLVRNASDMSIIKEFLSISILLEEEGIIDSNYIKRIQTQEVFEFHKKIQNIKLNYDSTGNVIPDYVFGQRFNCILFFYLYNRVLFMEYNRVLCMEFRKNL